ncbi:hypothetical protein [Arsenicibacter rosenii]|uniref:Uncharacterized protein n=1 Tax=Arsenicibacter rosenii TaxID=1750698 RepID=A0A1S2VHT1_9BACT|nr:hypothetical protein [Arsenicibacter rosenii]OIN58283.1 hypothetical protein BLX24_14880 [Arsenicibacter rosenii]
MSIFNFPRINIKGLMAVNVGTANNDDYSNDVFPPGSQYAGQPVRLADSVNVQPLMYGMTDDEWITWVQTKGTFSDPPAKTTALQMARSEGSTATADAPTYLIPAEWNFYGDMGLTMMGVAVQGVTDPDKIIPDYLLSELQTATLSFNNRPDQTGRSTGMLIDINPEDPSNSQIFADFLSLQSGNSFLFSGKPSKAITRWINFQRNVNLTGPNGAAASFQCVIPLSELQGQPILDGMPNRSPSGQPLAGVVCRMVMFRSMQGINTFNYPGDTWFDQIEALYAKKGLNPTYVQLQGTIAPWFEGEMKSAPTGRYLIPGTNTIPVPAGCRANGPAVALAPAIATIDPVNYVVSIDLSASLPEKYAGSYDPMETSTNPKYDFGTLCLDIVYQGNTTTIASIPYTDMDNDKTGWLFDFPFDAGLLTAIQDGTLAISSPTYGTLLYESIYYVVSDQSGVYAEQDTTVATTSQFRDYGADTTEISFTVFRKGAIDTNTPLALWYYDTTPNQQPGNRQPLMLPYTSGQPISLPVDSPGNRLITAVPATYSLPPLSYGQFSLLTFPIINIRILPNNVDYSQYYVNPEDPQPVGNELLTFDVIYNEVLRNYYLLYPAMSMRIPLNDPTYWNDAEMAGRLMQRISLDYWALSEAMPRTRDLSASRRTLLTAWCLKFFGNTNAPSPVV